jgi:SepF-like predicted cell division protein (DUF552 family)
MADVEEELVNECNKLMARIDELGHAKNKLLERVDQLDRRLEMTEADCDKYCTALQKIIVTESSVRLERKDMIDIAFEALK